MNEQVVPHADELLTELANAIRDDLPGVGIFHWPGTIRIRQENAPDLTALEGDTIRWDSVRVWRVLPVEDGGWDRGGD